MAEKLTGGDTFPALILSFVDGEQRQLPGCFDTPLTIALFYRGHW